MFLSVQINARTAFAILILLGSSPLAVNASASPLDVEPPQILKRVSPKYPKELSELGFRGDVLLEMHIDAAGRVEKATVLQSNHPGFNKPAVEAALKSTFKPATRHGVPVPIIAQQRFLFTTPGMEPPQARKTVSPKYPKELSKLGFRADVLLEMHIDAAGHVEKATVIQSNHPGFNKPAVDAALKSTFKPATRQGVPVPVVAQQRFLFTLHEMNDGGLEGFEVKREAGSQLSPERHYDVPAKPRNVTMAVYPYLLLREKRTGDASVAMMIDDAGKVVDAKIITESASEFGFAALAAAEQFSFTPASKAGRPVGSTLRLELKFSKSASQTFVQPPDMKLFERELNEPDRIVNGDQLDRPLKIISQKAAAFPLSLRTKSAAGHALVEFLVDDAGNVALPRIISAESPEFGYAAVQAVSQWRFEPPTVEGRKVATRARVPFNFTPTPTEPSR